MVIYPSRYMKQILFYKIIFNLCIAKIMDFQNSIVISVWCLVWKTSINNYRFSKLLLLKHSKYLMQSSLIRQLSIK